MFCYLRVAVALRSTSIACGPDSQIILFAGNGSGRSNFAHNLKLTLEDYPFANDGLILWDAINEWVTNYPCKSDLELHAWWKEIRTVGHGNKKEGWLALKTTEDVAFSHHSAVNFGQYAYAGYFPNRPTIAAIKMPNEDPYEEWMSFLENPDDELLKCYPSQI
ncbi:hypothetical protein RJ639_023319 [Escallonia herrerae]|uniref:Lipoxygenase domain-containing protein n=1 Tax=Escallonia herrerae TaxID=1293975 RepID=A0AA89AF07_9ASTE|nr:hypothetical protein RJ639_023319 [Escallonia herrerae]